jgi:hypothetical protein
MSLMYCPECGHEISNAAVACPNCGRPINAAPVVERKVVTTHPRRDGIPIWAIGVMGVLGVLLIFLLIAFWSRSGEDDGNRAVRVNMNTAREPLANRQTVESAPSSTMTIPPETGSAPISMPPSQTTVGGQQVAAPSKGTAVIQAKVVTRNNSQQPVRNQRFYLLDKDVESILSEAHVDPIEGQTLTDSLGLATLYPDRYSDFQQRALRAIKAHIKYAGTTDSAGKAQLSDIQPNSYYLFGVVKAGNGFAIWSSPVSIQAGENILDLTPQQITTIDQRSGEE